MNNIRSALFALIKCEITDTKLDTSVFSSWSISDYEKLFKLSSNHALAHIIGDALIKNNVLSDSNVKNKFLSATFSAVKNFSCKELELKKIQEVLEAAKIPYITLKGSVIRYYYPDPWVRTSCDIDILVHEEDLESSKKELTEKLNYKFEKKGPHDISAYSKQGVHLELHYKLIDDKRLINSDFILNDVWNRSFSHDNSSSYKMTDEMFYFHQIAHMAKHFALGGCGLRPFIDLFVLENTNHMGDDKTRNELLSKGGLTEFNNAVQKLIRVWFFSENHDDFSRQIEDFVLSGGTYGSIENNVAATQAKKGGRFKYAISMIWLPYDVIKYHYPSLVGRRALLPLYEFRRWCKLIFCGGIKRSYRDLAINAKISKSDMNKTRSMLEKLNLV